MSDSVFAGAKSGDLCRADNGRTYVVRDLRPYGARVIVPEKYVLFSYGHDGKLNSIAHVPGFPVVVGLAVTTEDDIKDYYV